MTRSSSVSWSKRPWHSSWMVLTLTMRLCSEMMSLIVASPVMPLWALTLRWATCTQIQRWKAIVGQHMPITLRNNPEGWELTRIFSDILPFFSDMLPFFSDIALLVRHGPSQVAAAETAAGAEAEAGRKNTWWWRRSRRRRRMRRSRSGLGRWSRSRGRGLASLFSRASYLSLRASCSLS